MKVFVTGGAGFIGSNFIRMCLNSWKDISITNLDKLTYAADKNILNEFGHACSFVYGDICDIECVRGILQTTDFDAIVHFAAESHVDRSIIGSVDFIRTNIIGTHTLLEAVREIHKERSILFLHVSTDEVYGSLSLTDPAFTEDNNIKPNSPYAASKASSDLLVHAYFKTYHLPIIITRCSNNYGPYQFPEKFIPLVITNALQDKPIPIYGDGLYVRDWIHVTDHCNAIFQALHNGAVGQVYNIGSNNEMSNINIVKYILGYLKKPESFITYVKDRPGHDRRYAMNADRAINGLEWQPKINFLIDGLPSTIEWYRNNEEWWKDKVCQI